MPNKPELPEPAPRVFKWEMRSVRELQDDGILLVEDGNHGEYRPRSDEFDEGGEYAFIRAADMVSGRVLFESAQRINDKAVERIRKGVGQGGDVLFSHKGTVGKLALAPLDSPAFVCSPQTTFWRTLDQGRLDRRYLYCFMRSQAFTDQWMARSNETDMAAYVSLTAQRQLNVAVPPIGEQRAIADVLGALDDKIEQNRGTARALEQLTRAIFQAWFVDFEPVKAKAAGATAFPSMTQPVFDALPTRFFDSTVGPVPYGWEVSTVGDCTSYLNRGIPPRYLEEGGVLVLNQKCIRDFAIDYGKARRHDTSSRGIEGRELKVGDVLVNSTGVGTLGRLAQLLHLPEPAIVDTHVTVVRPSSRVNPSYFGQALTFLQPHIESLGEGSTGQTELSRQKLSELRLLVPTRPLLDAFRDLAAPLIGVVSQMRLENQSLAKLRDYLLPKLMSGDVQVRIEGESGSA
jgi:type I restriction enzyme, S subunit